VPPEPGFCLHGHVLIPEKSRRVVDKKKRDPLVTAGHVYALPKSIPVLVVLERGNALVRVFVDYFDVMTGTVFLHPAVLRGDGKFPLGLVFVGDPGIGDRVLAEVCMFG